MFSTAYRAVAICGAIVSIGTMGNVRGQSPNTRGDQFRNVLLQRSTDRVEQIRETQGTRIPTAFGFVPGHYYTSNYDSRVINEYDETRTFVGTMELSFALGQNVRGLAFGADGLLYATLSRGVDGFAVLALRNDGSVAASYLGSYYVAGNASYGKIALDNQYLYVCGGALARFRLGEPLSGATIYTQGAIFDVKPLPSGNLFVASSDNIDEITNDGEFVRRIQLTGGQYFTDIRGIECNPESNILFVTHLGHTNFFHRIMRVDATSGALLNSAIFTYADDIFLDRSGNLLVGSTDRPPAFYSQDLTSLGNLSVDERQNFVTQYAPLGPTPTPTPPPVQVQALNISTRVQVGNAIGGFIITGSVPKRVAVRGIGPSLASSGITNVLADPILRLYDRTGALLLDNDNWQDDPAQAAQLTNLGLALQNPNESGIVATLEPGASYTADLFGHGDGTALVEIYDTDHAADSQLANISTLGTVGTGDNVMIGGFILGGSSTNTSVIVRGIGPSLAQYGVANPLADPKLELHDTNGTLLISNDNWQDEPTQAAELSVRGLAPTDVRESGIFMSLPLGTFTAILVGKNDSTGNALVEVYNVH